ncbi:hypothetical protein KAI87_14180, partial [Myxococcota bacterium]|nr:hypothetical protein [Myxococcota bacterium]
ANSLRNLFRLLDHIDTNGSSYSFNLTSPIKTDADPKEALTPAGQAFEKLKTTFKPYDQAFTTYIDLSPARVDTTKKPITLAVKHQTQPNSVACFHTSYAMVKDYDGALAGKMVSYYDSFYMAKTESSTGAIAGWKGDFETGIAYIDKMLEDMRPVLVGVSHSDKDYNYDKKTDHFVVITGRGNDEEGRLFYTYDDPATSGKYKTAKLYVDQKSSMLFRPPLTKSGFFNNSYQVTQVRPYLDAPVDDQKEG